MTDKNRLFSIGKLSRLTGVHIQSLRYYEQLGILKPAHIDPQSRYRYYTFQHTRIVEAIQYCADLDIPLKQFQNFLAEEDGQIDYAKLIECGVRLTNEKMTRIQKRLAFLEEVRQELLHAEKCRENIQVRRYFPQKLCWTIPYEGTQTAPDFHRAMYRLISDVEANGLRAGYNNGQLMFCRGKEIESYIFIDIRESEKELESFPQVITIPAGEYMCSVSHESSIRNAPGVFPELFEQDYDKVVVEMELFSEKFNYSTPVFEIRCGILPEEKIPLR